MRPSRRHVSFVKVKFTNQQYFFGLLNLAYKPEKIKM
jgi:hypothetical protein